MRNPACLFVCAFMMAVLTPRLPGSGLLPDDPKLIERIVAQAK
jgi:hypothetical protein